MKEKLLKEVIEIGNNNGYITYDDIMDVVDGDRELFEFIEDELLKMNDLNFELDL
jgi:predicted house-cleaning noncanonical NTP pyrophosphatase (MazG superfamily)